MLPLKQNGWIGVDVGTSAVKVAQLARSKGGLRLTGAAIVPRRSAWTAIEEFAANEPLTSADELCAASSLQGGFHGRRAAATLPMALCNAHSLDPSILRQSQDDRTVRQAIEMATQSSAENLQFDLWDAEVDESGQAPKRVNLLAVSRSWSDRLFDDLTLAGWSCQTIDGLPLALARAVAMADRSETPTPVAALDWGYAKATLCIVVNGSPAYVRCFKDCGISRLLNRISENLDVSEEEAQRLLQEHGLDAASQSSSSGVGELIEEIVAEPISQVQREFTRTITHLQGQRRSILPTKLYLFGGGATIKGIEDHFSSLLNTKTNVWQFGQQYCQSSGQTDLPSCLFGPAIALSALAWEQP